MYTCQAPRRVKRAQEIIEREIDRGRPPKALNGISKAVRQHALHQAHKLYHIVCTTHTPGKPRRKSKRFINRKYKQKRRKKRPKKVYKAKLRTRNGVRLSKTRRHKRALIDSGATQNVHPDKHALSQQKPSTVTGVKGVSGKRTPVTTQGTWAGMDTLHLPPIDQPILSVGQYLDHVNGHLVFTSKYVFLKIRGKPGHTKIGVRRADGLYTTCVPSEQLGRHTAANINLSLHAQVIRERINHLHRCLGHASKARMAEVLKRNKIHNLSVKHLELLSCCDACHTGKMRRANRPKPDAPTQTRTARPQPKHKKPKAPSFGHTVVADSSSKQVTRSRSGKRYANVMVDVYSRWSWATLLYSLKSTLDKCTSKILNELSPLTKIFRADLGSEFTNSKTKSYLQKHGIRLHFAAAGDHYQNGLAEVTIRILQNMARTLLADSKLPISFWGEAVVCANFLRNRLPCKGLNGKSPYEIRYGKKFDIRRLRPFGARCTVMKHSSKISGDKAKSRSYKGIMVGYSDPFGIKGWRIYVPSLRTIVMSPNALFLKNMNDSISLRPPELIDTSYPDLNLMPSPVPYNTTPTTVSSSPHTAPPPRANSPFDSDDSHSHNRPVPAPSEATPSSVPSFNDPFSHVPTTSPNSTQLSPSPPEQISPPTPAPSPPQLAPPTQISPPAHSPPPAATPRHSTRDHSSPRNAPRSPRRRSSPRVSFRSRRRLFSSPVPAPRRSSRLRAKRGTTYINPRSRDIQEGPQHLSRKERRHINKLFRCLHAHKCKQSATAQCYFQTMENMHIKDFYAAIASNPFAGDINLPENYEQAVSGKYARQWRKAIKSEIDSLKARKVFKLVDRRDLPRDANIISGKWVFKVKPKADGTIERFKCRLCARGFLQKYGIDYSATFSPVASAASIKLLLALAAEKRMHLRQADVSTAFLYGDLPESERVYMQCPPGIDHKEGQVIELRRCIYGLKQASRRWFDKLRKTLIRAGYKPTRSDPCLYRRLKHGRETLVAVVVDDLLIAADTSKDTKRVIKHLRKAGLDTKDLGRPEYVVGMHIDQHADGTIAINQKLYINTILRRFQMQDAHGCSTPADPNVKLSKALAPGTDAERKKMAARPYRSLVGALLYVLLTRPDCAVAVNELARYLDNPGPAMWTAAKRVLRYLKSTINHNVVFAPGSRRKSRRTKAFVDASHAGDKDTRRSRCGHILYYNRCPILWRTVLQKRVALSTGEAEYRAVTIASKDILWLRNILGELGRKQRHPTKIYEDNDACITMVNNPIISGRNKYVELDCHFIRDHQIHGHIQMQEIDTKDQRADLLTKNLVKVDFVKHTRSILDTGQSCS